MEHFLDAARQDGIILAQALVALLLGGLVGWEREAAGKWAGFRTHMLVCLATFLFVKLGNFLVTDMIAAHPGGSLRADPVRIIEAIVTGIAFLGAGTVFRDLDADKARGLTTAASLLIIAPIGIAIALDRYVLALGVTGLALFVLRTLHALEQRFTRER